MLYTLLIIWWVVCGILILRSSGVKRLCFYFLGILYVPATIDIIPQSMLMGHFFYATMFILSMILYNEFKLKTFTSCPLFSILGWVFVSYLLIGLFDERVSTPLSIYRAIHAFCGSYFLFYLGWVSINQKDRNYRFLGSVPGHDGDYNIFFRTILPLTLLMTLFGLYTGLTHTNPILDAVGLEDRFLMESNEDTYRGFRVTAMCISSSVYGLVCATLFLCSFFTTKHKSILRWLALGLLLINLILSATRAAIIPFIIGLFVFILIHKGITGILRTFIIILITVLFLFPLLPSSVTDYFSQMTDSISDVILPGGTGGSKYGGSSVDAREMQIITAMEYLKEKPFFGHGFGYYGEVLSQGEKVEGLLGMESYLCFMGVERGLVNFCVEIIFYICSFYYFIKNRVYNRLYADLGIALLTMFIPFLIFAWVGGCWFFFMPVLGYVAKVVYLSKFRQF